MDNFSPWRRLLLELKLLQRRHVAKIRENKNGWLARMAHIDLFSFRPAPLRRGLAIGLFWAFIPMPFQMLPATFFCLIAAANLPIALLCVWISNPLTYAPIFYAEAIVGKALHHSKLGDLVFGAMPQNAIALSAAHVLIGGIVFGIIFAVAGYLTGPLISRKIQRLSQRRKKREQ